MSEVERIAELLRDARQSVKGLILSAHEKDCRMALYLIAHGVDIPVRCEDCIFCEEDEMGGWFCKHPDNRNPRGCRATDYCDGGVRREANEAG